MIEENAETPISYPLWKSCRLSYVVCVFLSSFNLMILRYNLSFAIVCMVKSPKNRAEFESEHLLLGLDIRDLSTFRDNHDYDMGEFEWSKPIQGLVLSGFFYGYISSLALGGWLCSFYSARKYFIYGNVVQSICTILIPVAARIHPICLFILRIIQGFSCGLAFPAVNALFLEWSHPTERTKLISWAYVGYPLGIVITFPLSSLLCKTNFDHGWTLVFYVTGFFSLGCAMLYEYLVYNTAAEHPRISEEEKRFLQSSLNRNEVKRNIPYKSIATSRPYYAYLVAHFCQVWGYVTISLCLPMYYKEVMKFNIFENGLVSSLPMLVGMASRILIGIAFGPVHLLTKLSLTNFRKVNHAIGTFVPALLLICITTMSSDSRIGVVCMLCLIYAIADVGYCGSYVFSLLDLAPDFCGFLTGIATTICSIPGILISNVIGYITTDGTRREWNNVLYIMAMVYIFGGVCYIIFGSSKLQRWGGREKGEEEIK